MQKEQLGPLSSFRGLDLTEGQCMLSGKIMADLGADVLVVEKPGGNRSRFYGPFYGGTPHPERSLLWFAYNSNKRSITLDLATVDGRELFKMLAKKVDFIIESFEVDYLASLGLDYSHLSQINQGLVMTSISPFGQEGPYRGYKAPDLIGMAMSGLMYPVGDPDRPPVRIGYPQAYSHAALQALVGTLLALYEKGSSGLGQHVDVSMQASAVLATAGVPLFWETLGGIVLRQGPARTTGMGSMAPSPVIWPCRDGYVNFMLIGGPTGAKSNSGLRNWMAEEGIEDKYLQSIDWPNWSPASATVEEFERISKPISKFFLSRDKKELEDEAVKRGIMLYSLNTMSELLSSKQFEESGFWQYVEYPELNNSIRCPGPVVRCSDWPYSIRRRAPLVGEHNDEIYFEELGISKEELALLKSRGAI